MQDEEHHAPEESQDDFSTGEAPTQETISPEENMRALEPETSHNMVIIAVLAVAVVVLALMYMWGSSVQDTLQTPDGPVPAELKQTPTSVTEDPTLDALNDTSSSDEMEEIEKDLRTTELDSLDAEVEQIEQEIEEALEE